MLQQFHLLYANSREEDIRRMKQIMAGTGIEIFSPYEVGARVHVKTKGLDPVENARIKAMAYYQKMGIPSIAVESGLYIEGLPEEEQPAAQYRKYKGIRLSDEDCIDYYCALANRIGKQIKAMFLPGSDRGGYFPIQRRQPVGKALLPSPKGTSKTGAPSAVCVFGDQFTRWALLGG